MSELENIIELVDEEGNMSEFEYLDTVLVDETEYVILVPAGIKEEEEIEEIVIMKIDKSGEEEILVAVEDDEELQRAYDAFIEVANEDFDFDDEE